MKKDLEYYLGLNWTYNFEWSNEDECYIASVAELKGCKSHGETIEEAAKMIKDALNSHISGMLEAGFEIPEPLKPEEYKGKISLRISPETHYRVAKRARAIKISINSFIDLAIEDKLNSEV